MDLQENYFPLLGQYVLEFVVALVLVAGVYFLTRRWISKDLVARAFRWGMLSLIYVSVSAFALNAFMSTWGFRGEASPFGFERMLDHTAERPYVYRVLSGEVIKRAARLIPKHLSEERRRWLLEESPLLQYRRPGEGWSLEKSKHWHVAYFYLFLTLLAALFAARVLTHRVCDVTPLFADLAPAVAALFLPLTFHLGGYFYDFPELLLMLLCLLSLVKWRPLWFYPLFVIAILNKESNALLVTFFVALMWERLPRRQLLLHAAAQLGIGAAIVWLLRMAFLGSQGAQGLFFFPLNVLFWLRPASYVQFITPYAPLIPVPRGANLISLFLVAFLVLWEWRRKPAELKRLLLLPAVFVFPLFYVFGMMDEVRALSLLFPGLYLLGCHTVNDVYGRLRTGADP